MPLEQIIKLEGGLMDNKKGRNYINNFTDDELITFAKESKFLSDFTRKIGYKGNNRLGANSRKLIKEKLNSLGINLTDCCKKNINEMSIKNYTGFDGTKGLQDGFYAEQLFVLKCLEYNIIVSKPIQPTSSYDFIIDINNTLLKIQVKASSSIKSNTTYFRTRHGDAKDIGYSTLECDYFFLYSIPRKKAFFIKNDNPGQSGYKIRFDRPQNNSSKKIRYEEDCLFDTVIKNILEINSL